MSKQEKKGWVPALRFPEFREAGEWEKKRLGEALKFQAGFPFSSASFNEERNGLRLIRNRDLKSDDKIIFYSDSYDEHYVVDDGDVLVGMDGDFTPCVWNKGKALLNQRVGRIIAKEGNSQRFAYYFLAVHLKAIEEATARTTVKHLSHSDVEKIHEPIPHLSEQIKIADCLTSVDELITAQTKKLDALNTHKKGLMQQLFPAEGETVPKLRFPEFRDKGEWLLQKLEGLAKRGSGHTPNKQMSNYYNGGIKWVSLADSNKLDNGYIYDTKIQISKEGIENSSAVLHPAGAVILSRDAGVGKSAVLHSEMAVSQHFIAWVCDESKLSNWFLYYVLQILKPAFERVAVGNTIKTIGLPYFKELCISAPSISEQKKIADSLISIDELISKQAKKVEALKSHKKGLMQQLFPSVGDNHPAPSGHPSTGGELGDAADLFPSVGGVAGEA